MKKAFTLIEMLLIITTIPVFMLVTSRLFNSLMRETPRVWNDIQQNTTMLNMLSHIQSDIDNAQNIPQSYREFTATEKLLLIEQEDLLIGYEFEDGQITRRILNDTQTNHESHAVHGTEQENKWQIPDAKIQWNVHTKDGNGYCLEITNYIESQDYSRTEKKMMNSHLYFIGAM